MKINWLRKTISCVTLMAFLSMNAAPSFSQIAQSNILPAPGQMVGLSAPFSPATLKGIKVYPDNPFRFDFILDPGETDPEPGSESVAAKLIRYFLASLTIPEKDLWVNLSPYEQERIITNEFGQTEMGRDLLSQDYLLKQITASLIYPEGDVGKKFWAKVYQMAFDKYGTTDIPVDTFNKVWITPDKAVVYENGDKAFIVKSHMKVMLESDYLAESHSERSEESQSSLVGVNHDTSQITRDSSPLAQNDNIAKDVLREIAIPELEREVNEGKNFAPLRQVYQSFILAAWFKKKIKESLLSQVYVDQKKVAGVNIDDPQMSQKIWAQYVAAFKKGAYDYVKEEKDAYSGELIPRKYFSGGIDASQFTDMVMEITDDAEGVPNSPKLKQIESGIVDAAEDDGKNLETMYLNLLIARAESNIKGSPQERRILTSIRSLLSGHRDDVASGYLMALCYQALYFDELSTLAGYLMRQLEGHGFSVENVRVGEKFLPEHFYAIETISADGFNEKAPWEAFVSRMDSPLVWKDGKVLRKARGTVEKRNVVSVSDKVVGLMTDELVSKLEEARRVIKLTPAEGQDRKTRSLKQIENALTMAVDDRGKIELVNVCFPKKKQPVIRDVVDYILQQLEKEGFEFVGMEGEKFDSGLVLRVRAFQPAPGFDSERPSVEVVDEDIMPTIYKDGKRIQLGEVIVLRKNDVENAQITSLPEFFRSFLLDENGKLRRGRDVPLGGLDLWYLFASAAEESEELSSLKAESFLEEKGDFYRFRLSDGRILNMTTYDPYREKDLEKLPAHSLVVIKDFGNYGRYGYRTIRYFIEEPEGVGVSDKTSLDQLDGGIDLNSNRLDLQVQDAGGAVKMNVDPAMLRRMQAMPGFAPVIIGIKPLASVKAFLGIPNN